MSTPGGSPAAGTCAEVTVPATSANLGPGYDSFGLAVNVYDRVQATVLDHSVDQSVSVRGEGSDILPRDERHLVLRVIRDTLGRLGADPAIPLELKCHNVIPQSRGMGSSAAAVVAGVSLANQLAIAGGARERGRRELLSLATRWEGHPDNAAPAIFGGATLSWMIDGEPATANLRVRPDITVVLVAPSTRLDTAVARSLIPRSIPHGDAIDNSAHAGLLVHALSEEPSLLHEATRDWLHQEYRRPAMPQTLDMVDALREAGIAATVSGAGPTVLAIGTDAGLAGHVRTVLGARLADATVFDVDIDARGAVARTTSNQ